MWQKPGHDLFGCIHSNWMITFTLNGAAVHPCAGYRRIKDHRAESLLLKTTIKLV